MVRQSEIPLESPGESHRIIRLPQRILCMNGVVALPTPISSSSFSDRDLVRGARAGRQEEIEELARRGRRWAYILALQLLGNPEEAKDVAQDAMLRFFTTLDRFDNSRPVRPWLLTIVRNRVRDLWRRRKSRPTVSIEGENDLSLQIIDTRANPERDARRANLRRRIWRALSSMPEDKREIVVLRDFHNLSYAELAKVLGVPQGTVMSRLHRARAELRKTLEKSPAHFGTRSQGAGHD